jgi:hypothetical protein
VVHEWIVFFSFFFSDFFQKRDEIDEKKKDEIDEKKSLFLLIFYFSDFFGFFKDKQVFMQLTYMT